MGTVDKGLVVLDGRPMVSHVLQRLAPQVDEILINANQHHDDYAAFGHRVVPDAIGGFAGPLAGLHVGLAQAAHALVVTVPCDSPFLPLDLVARLRTALDANAAVLAVARTFDQPHPVFALVRRQVLPHLTHFLESGGTQDRRVVRDARDGGSRVRRRSRRLSQYQYRRRALRRRRGEATALIRLGDYTPGRDNNTQLLRLLAAAA